MGIIHQNIPNEILKEFYEAARKKFGDKKGCKHSALLEAITKWTREERGRK